MPVPDGPEGGTLDVWEGSSGEENIMQIVTPDEGMGKRLGGGSIDLWSLVDV